MSFPGATALTVLEVYDWIAPDGLRGGSAHVHLASAEGYVVALRDGAPSALTEFYAAAVALVGGRAPQWRERWQTGSLQAALLTGRQLDQVAAGDASYLPSGVLRRGSRGAQSYGMCGRLTRLSP